MKIIDYAENLNAIGIPEGVIKVVKKSAGLIGRYPDHTHAELKYLFAEHMGLDPEGITFGAGTTEIIYHLPALLQKGRILIPTPTFWQYEAANQGSKESISPFPITKEKGFQVDDEELKKEVRKSKVVYLCNPNNPTSKLYDTESIKSLVQEFPDVEFVIDETYLYFLEEFEQKSLMSLAQKVRNLYVVMSFSKFFSLPGLRTGVLVTSSENIRKYEQQMVPYTLSPLALPVLTHVLKDRDFINSVRRTIKKRIAYTYTIATEILPHQKFAPIEPEGPFMLIEITGKQNSTTTEAKMKKRGLLIRDCAPMKGLGDKWIRVSCRSEEEMRMLFVNLSDTIQ